MKSNSVVIKAASKRLSILTEGVVLLPRAEVDSSTSRSLYHNLPYLPALRKPKTLYIWDAYLEVAFKYF